MTTNHAALKSVFITGGSRGIGLSLVRTFKKHNYRVLSCSRHISAELSEEADEAFVCDVSDPLAIKSLATTIRKKINTLDVIINNAGIAGANSLDVLANDDLWYHIIATNLHGTYHICKEFLPLVPRKGRIINITSVLAHRGVADQSAYCAAKHGVLGFTKSLALKLAPQEITVNSIAPGWVDTKMAQERAVSLKTDLHTLAQHNPNKRILSPDEVANLAIFLASESADSITGQSYIIDGGYLA